MRRRGTITAEDQDLVETWENIATHQNALVRIDARGDEKQEVISGRREFIVTTEERLITEKKILDVKVDPFKKGGLLEDAQAHQDGCGQCLAQHPVVRPRFVR